MKFLLVFMDAIYLLDLDQNKYIENATLFSMLFYRVNASFPAIITSFILPVFLFIIVSLIKFYVIR